MKKTNSLLKNLGVKKASKKKSPKILKKKSFKSSTDSLGKKKHKSPKPGKERKNKLKKKKIDAEQDVENGHPETFKSIRDDEKVPCGNLEAEKCFDWLIAPVTAATFFKDVWEKKPLHINRQGNEHYKSIFSCKEFDRILRENHLEFTRNIDVVQYKNGERSTLNPNGRAYAPIIWDYFQNSSSIRLLNPQTYSKTLWRLNSLLQEYFGSFVGANMYLTPADSQGFAPHYDDIEAFILQLEGKKQWKIYAPRSPSECCPRFSSVNFTQEEIGSPILEIELNPGDLLYFPRGYIHQAKTTGDIHSLHITLSTYQKTSWGDLLELMLPRALQMAIEEDLEFRQGLPKDYLSYVGVVNSDNDCLERTEFQNKVVHLTKKLAKYLPIDSSVDQKGKEFVHSSLPPFLTQDEKSCSIHGNGEVWCDGKVQSAVQLQPDSEIRFIRKQSVRLVMEEESVRLYHTLENSRIFQENDPQYIELGAELAPAIEHLWNKHPDFVQVEDLPLPYLDQKMDIANLLYDKGILMTKDPLPAELDSD